MAAVAPSRPRHRDGKARRKHDARLGVADIHGVLASAGHSDSADSFAAALDARRLRFTDDSTEHDYDTECRIASLGILAPMAYVVLASGIYYMALDVANGHIGRAARFVGRIATLAAAIIMMLGGYLMRRDHSRVHSLYVPSLMSIPVLFVPAFFFVVEDMVSVEWPQYNEDHPNNTVDVRRFETITQTIIMLILVFLMVATRVPLRIVTFLGLVIWVELIVFNATLLDFIPLSRTAFRIGLFTVFALLIFLLGLRRDMQDRRAFWARREIQEDTRQVKKALDTSDLLLRNVLPAKIARQLKNTDLSQSSSQLFHHAAVVFVDMGHVAADQAALSSSVICWLDDVADQTGVEKVKSTGSSWMGVSGAPYDDERRCVLTMVDFAAAVMHKVDGMSFATASGKVDLRIGVAQGSVVTAVLATGRLKWDCFGDTVNLASRLSTNATMGTVHVSETVKRNVEEFAPGVFVFEERTVYLKGKGETTTFLLDPNGALGPDADPIGLVAPTVIGGAFSESEVVSASTPRTLSTTEQQAPEMAGDEAWAALDRYSESAIYLHRLVMWRFRDPEVEREYREHWAAGVQTHFKTRFVMIAVMMTLALVLELAVDDADQHALLAASRLILGLVQAGAYLAGQRWPSCRLAAQRVGFAMVALAFAAASVIRNLEVGGTSYSRLGEALSYEFSVTPTAVAVFMSDRVAPTAVIALMIPLVGRLISDFESIFMDFFMLLVALVGFVMHTKGLITSFLLKQRLALIAERVAESHARAEKLLYRAFPAAILDKLRTSEAGAVSEAYESVSMIQADIAGFTAMASQIEPTELVAFIGAMFERFDKAAAEVGVEGLKTLGDAWLACVGLPEARTDHFAVACKLGLAMIESVADIESPVRGGKVGLRVGVSSGAVEGAIVGKSRIAFDVFGPVPGRAGELESSAMTNTVHIDADGVREARALGYHVEQLPDGTGLLRPGRILI